MQLITVIGLFVVKPLVRCFGTGGEYYLIAVCRCVALTFSSSGRTLLRRRVGGTVPLERSHVRTAWRLLSIPGSTVHRANNDFRIMFIHSIVRAAILLSTLRCQSRRQPPISTPDEDPPAYPTLENDFPLRTPVETSASDLGGAKSPNGGRGDTPAASSTTLTDVIVTPGSSAESDAGDDAGEDRPLLYHGQP